MSSAGCRFNEASPQDSRRHIEIVFDIARQFDADIDMHVDETDDPAARTLEVVAELTIANGWQGRVTAGHTCALAGYPRDYADHVIGRLHEANVNMIANPATNLMLQGRLDDYPKRRGVTQVKELLAAGVNVACGQDCVHDTFYPFGQNDPLEIAFLLCHGLPYEPAGRDFDRHGHGDQQWREGATGAGFPGRGRWRCGSGFRDTASRAAGLSGKGS